MRSPPFFSRIPAGPTPHRTLQPNSDDITPEISTLQARPVSLIRVT